MTPPQGSIVLPIADAQAIVDYLKQRPYQEVAPLIHNLLRAPKAEEQKPGPKLEEPTP
jgi:hypothetical protein